MYQEWSFLAFVNVMSYDKSLNKPLDIFSYVLAVAFSIIALITPKLIKTTIKMLLFSRHGIEPNPTLQTLYEGLNLQMKGAKMHYYYYTMNALVLSLSYVLLKEFLILYLFLINFMAIRHIYEYGTERQYKHKILNKIEKSSKLCFYVTAIFFTCYPVTENFYTRLIFLGI